VNNRMTENKRLKYLGIASWLFIGCVAAGLFGEFPQKIFNYNPNLMPSLDQLQDKDIPLIDFKNLTAEQLNSISTNSRNYAVCLSLKTSRPLLTMSKSYKELCSSNSWSGIILTFKRGEK